ELPALGPVPQPPGRLGTPPPAPGGSNRVKQARVPPVRAPRRHLPATGRPLSGTNRTPHGQNRLWPTGESPRQHPGGIRGQIAVAFDRPTNRGLGGSTPPTRPRSL